MKKELEINIINTLLHNSKWFETARDILHAADFTMKYFREIYQTMLRIYDRHKFIENKNWQLDIAREMDVRLICLEFGEGFHSEKQLLTMCRLLKHYYYDGK